jgi:hypothetical protein
VSPGTSTSPSSPTAPPATANPMAGSASNADSSLHGMGQSGTGDMAYQQAYRDCMKQRGF